MPIAYLNGQWIPAEQAAVNVTDAGFILGVTCAEQLRTFGGKLFRLDQHLQRLAASLEIVGVDPGKSWPELKQAAERLVESNHRLLADGDDLGLAIFVTPGTYSTFAEASPALGPTVCMHTFPLPFHQWASKYESGQALVVSQFRQVPVSCWPASLKCRSRMHYYLADKQAREMDPAARALLLDTDGFVSETSTASVLIYRVEEGLVAPPREKALPGISLSVLTELARELGLAFVHRDLTVEDVAAADEVLLCSTSLCATPVTRLNGRAIGRRPPEVYGKLIAAWSEMVGLDIVAQARRFSAR